MTADDARGGDVVFVRCHDRFLLHLVKEVREGEVLIGNNVGKSNGWVAKTSVMGKVVAVED